MFMVEAVNHLWQVMHLWQAAVHLHAASSLRQAAALTILPKDDPCHADGQPTLDDQVISGQLIQLGSLAWCLPLVAHNITAK